MIAESKTVPSAQTQQIAVANSRDPSCNVCPPREFDSGRSAGKSSVLVSGIANNLNDTSRLCMANYEASFIGIVRILRFNLVLCHQGDELTPSAMIVYTVRFYASDLDIHYQNIA